MRPAPCTYAALQHHSFDKEAFVVGNNREVDQAVSALTAEILKLSPLDGEAESALGITIGNALTRFALAILAQSNQTQEECLEAAMPATASV